MSGSNFRLSWAALRSSCRNASKRTALPEAVLGSRSLCGKLFLSAARLRNRKAQRARRKGQGLWFFSASNFFVSIHLSLDAGPS